ncbi:MAG: hypothetical protein SNJ70_02615 [Armatimonadota bacterium]
MQITQHLIFESTDYYFFGAALLIILIVIGYFIVRDLKRAKQQKEINTILQDETDEEDENLTNDLKSEFGNPINTIVYAMMFLGGPVAIYKYLKNAWESSPEGSPIKTIMTVAIMIIAAFILLSIVKTIERKIYRENVAELYEARESNLYER